MEIICIKKISIPKITPPVAGENPCKGQDENSKWLEQFILKCIHASFFPLSCEEHPTFGLTVMKLKMLSPFWSELNSVNALLVLLCKRTFYFHYLLQVHMNTELSTFGQRVQRL